MDHSAMNLDMGELESPGNFEIEDCTRIIQASLTKILDTRCERRGPNLRKSLMVLRVIQRARTEQRNRYFSPPCSPSYAMDMSPSSQSLSSNHQMGGGLFIPVAANYSQQLQASGTRGILSNQLETEASNCLPMSVDQADVENSNPSPRLSPINLHLSSFHENIPHSPPCPPAEWISQSLEESRCREEKQQTNENEELYPRAMTSPDLVEPMEDDSLVSPLQLATPCPVSQSEAVNSPIDLQCKIANREPARIIGDGMGLSLSEKCGQPANTDNDESCVSAMDLTSTSADQLSFSVSAEDDDVFLPSLPSTLVSAPETANQHRASYGIPIKSSQMRPLNLTQTPIMANQRQPDQDQDHQFDFELNGDDCDEQVEPLVLANSSFGNIGEHLSAVPSSRKVREVDQHTLLPKQGFDHSLAAIHDIKLATDKPIVVDTENNATTHFVDFDDDDDEAPPSIFHIDQSVDVTVLEPVNHSCDANKSVGELDDFVPDNFNPNTIEPIDGKCKDCFDGDNNNAIIEAPDMSNFPTDSTLNRAVLSNYFLAFGHDSESDNKKGHTAADDVKKDWRTLNNQGSRKRKIFRPHAENDHETCESMTENLATPEPPNDSSVKKHKRSSVAEESIRRIDFSEEPANDGFSNNASILSLPDSTPTAPAHSAIYSIDKHEPSVNDSIDIPPSSPITSSSAISNLISMFSAGFHVLMESVSTGRFLTVGVHGVYESGVPVGHEATEREPQVVGVGSRNHAANFDPFHHRASTTNTNDRPSTSSFNMDGHFDSSFTESGRGGRGMIDENLELGDPLDNSNSVDCDSHSPRFQTANFLSENSTSMVLPQELVCH